MDITGKAARAWAAWFSQVYKLLSAVSPSVSADNGDNSVTLNAASSAKTQRWNTALTAARTISLDTTTIFKGAKFRIVREAGCTGAFNLNVGTGPLKALTTAGTWCEVEYDGTAWRLTAAGSL